VRCRQGERSRRPSRASAPRSGTGCWCRAGRRARLSRIHDAAIKALAAPENRKTIDGAGAAVEGPAPQAFKARMEREYNAWGDIVAKVGVTEE
jgi:tripartite-type tricarboxylate transporter receptor subunit TctC